MTSCCNLCGSRIVSLVYMNSIVKEERGDGGKGIVRRRIYVGICNLSFFCVPHGKTALCNCFRCTISELNCKGFDYHRWSGRFNGKLPTIAEKTQRVSTFLVCGGFHI